MMDHAVRSKRFATIGLFLIFVAACSSDASSPTSTSPSPTTEKNDTTQIDCVASAAAFDQSKVSKNSDGTTTASCSELSSLYDSGSAICSGSKQPWDISSCHVREIMDQYIYPHDIDSKRWPNAICNDGTSFTFTVTFPHGYNALTAEQKLETPYQIELQGGGQCVPGKDIPTDDEPCENRTKTFLGAYSKEGFDFPKATSADPTGDLTKTNLPSPGEPLVDKGLENAIRIWGHYCSSDVWTGQNLNALSDNLGSVVDGSHYGPSGMFVSTVSKNFTKWPMTGYYNFLSMLDIVTERFGMKDSNSKLRIHFRGQSAGGYGVMSNMSTLVDRFPEAHARALDGKGAIQGSSWQSWIPRDFVGTVHTDGSTQFNPTLSGLSDHAVSTVWDSHSPKACSDAGKTQGDCLFSTTLYDYVTSSGETNLGQGLGIPLLIYMNRQDEGHYMPFAGILPLNINGQAVDADGNTNTTAAAEQAAARQEWIRKTNIEMGIQSSSDTNLPIGKVTTSSRIKWLFTPSDPQLPTIRPHIDECNVHPPLDWLSWSAYNGTTWDPHNLDGTSSPPDVADNSLENMTGRFWTSFGAGSEVHAYNGAGGSSDPFSTINYVNRTENCEK